MENADINHAVLRDSITTDEKEKILHAESFNNVLHIIMRHESIDMICAGIDAIISPSIATFVLFVLKMAEDSQNPEMRKKASEILKLARKLRINGVKGLEEIELNGIILLTPKIYDVNNN